MEYNKLAEAVHKNAVAHGWWDEPRNFASLIGLIHSEISEALEEERNKRPFIYVVNDDGAEETDMSKFNGRKPEGAGVELVDAVIRILDIGGRYKVDIDGLMKYKFTDGLTDINTLIADCHYYISEAYMENMAGKGITEIFDSLCEVVEMIKDYIGEAGYSFKKIIDIKHEYNKTRPYKHGKAF